MERRRRTWAHGESSKTSPATGLRPPKGRTWGRRGRTPVVRVAAANSPWLSLAALLATKPGHRPRLILRTHRGRRGGRRKGFTEADYAALLDAAHRQLGGPIVLVWDNLDTYISAGACRASGPELSAPVQQRRGHLMERCCWSGRCGRAGPQPSRPAAALEADPAVMSPGGPLGDTVKPVAGRATKSSLGVWIRRWSDATMGQFP